VEGGIDLLFGPHDLAIDGDQITRRIDLGAEQADDLTVDRNAAGKNNLLASAAGIHTGIGEKFLEADHEK
jgi:hypothetical protein